MVTKKEVIRNYTFSDAELVQLSDKILSHARRDLAELSAYGYTAQRLEQIETLRDEFQMMPDDIEFSATLAGATEEKNAASASVRLTIKSIMARAEAKFGIKSPKYERFGAGELSRQTDSELAKTAHRVVRSGKMYLSELAEYGLTEAILEDLEAKAKVFDDLIDRQEDAIADRDVATQTRRETGNRLYEAITTLSNFGKTIWQSSDQARFNDYILGTSTDSPKPADSSTEPTTPAS
jgi:hypothetical protein